LAEIAQAAFRFAAHRFFCACDIRFRAAADTLRGPRLAAPLTAFRPFAALAAGLSEDVDVVAV